MRYNARHSWRAKGVCSRLLTTFYRSSGRLSSSVRRFNQTKTSRNMKASTPPPLRRSNRRGGNKPAKTYSSEFVWGTFLITFCVTLILGVSFGVMLGNGGKASSADTGKKSYSGSSTKSYSNYDPDRPMPSEWRRGGKTQKDWDTELKNRRTLRDALDRLPRR